MGQDPRRTGVLPAKGAQLAGSTAHTASLSPGGQTGPGPRAEQNHHPEKIRYLLTDQLVSWSAMSKDLEETILMLS